MYLYLLHTFNSVSGTIKLECGFLSNIYGSHKVETNGKQSRGKRTLEFITGLWAGQDLRGDLGSLLMAKGKESSEMEPFQD